ncbi:Peptidase family M28 [Geosmithia morbida]|uniref:Peptide hydrolase n=1 Tax=Geosmithia morbida TaxID=1094350 RepID=A0A9P5CZS5_9HYPO|nr:Peptidase family M28 [Geosmithia morbida]KAF4121923.1 Peptidase family M28 [Geosmithia morbida]
MKLSNLFTFGPAQVTLWTTTVYLAIIISLVVVHEIVPSAPSDASLPSGVNITEAWLDLQNITTHYHPYNSRANDGVRAYLIERSKEILNRNNATYDVVGSGLEKRSSDSSLITLFDDQVSNFTRLSELSRWTPVGGTYFEGNNFYVYIRGTEDPDGDWWNDVSSVAVHGAAGVLVNCHFDSVSTGFGATDDGVGCVTILQLLSYFIQDGNQPTNGIVLLFNNAEEDGLLGANAFSQHPISRFPHTFVNLEGAGAGGRAILFRATDLEIAKAYARSPYPFGSIVAADAFEQGVISSGTDYSVFKDVLGQRGMDIAFYAPRARYHTDQDDTRFTSADSVWHMLSAALASTRELSKTTGKLFTGHRGDGDVSKVQNGKPTRGVWFDLYGSAWGTLPLKGLFAWSLTLLVTTPLILVLISYLLSRAGKYYIFSRDIKSQSETSDAPVKIGGWRGFFRFPIAFVFAAGLTVVSALLLAKINPFIIYSSPYTVWAMTLSLFYFVFWLIVRGASLMRPSALHRAFSLFWLFITGWVLQVLASIAEDRWKVGSLYPMAFFHTAVFTSLVISLLELSTLPKKHEFVRQVQGIDIVPEPTLEPEAEEYDHNDTAEDNDDGHETGGEEEATPTETTPLRVGERTSRGRNQQFATLTTFGSTYRQSVASEASARTTTTTLATEPFGREQLWSGSLPRWTWIIQFLLVAPIPVIMLGNLGLVAMSALQMTGTDGGNTQTPLQTIAVISIILLLPLTPFLHRVTHHIPVFLFVVFVGTLVYNLTVFPFCMESRFKFYFQQIVNIDEGTDVVRLSGIETFVRPIISSLPSAAGQDVKCVAESGIRARISMCDYDASSLSPNLVEGKKLDELISLGTSKSEDGGVIILSLKALETRTCVLNFSRPVYSFFVEGGARRDSRLGDIPRNGFKTIDLWRRSWDGAWNITLDLKPPSAPAGGVTSWFLDDEEETLDQLRAWSDPVETWTSADALNEPFDVTVACKWSDANEAITIPALHELKQFMPSWAAVTKRQVGLVEVQKRFQVA